VRKTVNIAFRPLLLGVITCCCVDVSDGQDLSSVYGEYLMSSGCCLEAGLILARSSHYERALAAFEDCLEWRQAVMMASQLNYSELQFTVLARRLAGECLGLSDCL